jgi:hypothetical protein
MFNRDQISHVMSMLALPLQTAAADDKEAFVVSDDDIAERAEPGADSIGLDVPIDGNFPAATAPSIDASFIHPAP